MLRAGSNGNACVWGRGGLIYLFVAYSGGVLMFIHRFHWGLMRQNLCNYFLYGYHMQPTRRAIHSMFFAWHENLWEPQSDFQLHLTISNKDPWAAGRSVLTARVFYLLVSNPNCVLWRERNTSPLPHLVVNPEAVVDSGCRRKRETFGLYK